MKLPIKTKPYALFLLWVLAFAIFPGCAKYQAQRIVPKEKIIYSFEEHKSNIDLTIRAFDQDEFKNYLSKYQPIHLHIKNKTAYAQEMPLKNISLPIETLENLKKQEPKLFSINFIPCVLTSVLGIIFCWQIVLPTVFILGSCACQQSIRQHERSIKYLKNNAKFLNETLVIPPFESIDTLVFVKRTQYTPRFNITFTTAATNTTTTFNAFITARTSNAYYVSC